MTRPRFRFAASLSSIILTLPCSRPTSTGLDSGLLRYSLRSLRRKRQKHWIANSERLALDQTFS